MGINTSIFSIANTVILLLMSFNVMAQTNYSSTNSKARTVSKFDFFTKGKDVIHEPKVCVYPGDVNNNGIVTMLDLIDWAKALGTPSGPKRSATTIEWGCQIAKELWGDNDKNGVDDVFADCDGDGSLTISDTKAIVQNYTHPDLLSQVSTEYDKSNWHLRCAYSSDNGDMDGDGTIDMLLFDMYLEDSLDTKQKRDIFGLTFTLDLGGAQVTFDDSVLGVHGKDMIGMSRNFIDASTTVIGMTRLDNSDMMTSGEVCIIGCLVEEEVYGVKPYNANPTNSNYKQSTASNHEYMPIIVTPFNVEIFTVDGSVAKIPAVADTIWVLFDHYCRPEVLNPEPYITSVQIGEQIRESGNDGGHAFSDSIITVSKSTINKFKIQSESTGLINNFFYKVWIDYNQNNEFEVDELVVSKRGGQLVEDETITISQYALTGVTRLRVVVSRRDVTDPCGYIYNGEVEDYLVNITDGLACNLSTLVEESGSFYLLTIENGIPPYELNYDSGVKRVNKRTDNEFVIVLENSAAKPQITVTDADGCQTTVDWPEGKRQEFVKLPLEVNVFPNPAKEHTTFTYDITEENTNVRLEIFNLSGQKVATVVEEIGQTIGRHQQVFTCSDLPQGSYLYRLQTNETATSGKLLIVR